MIPIRLDKRQRIREWCKCYSIRLSPEDNPEIITTERINELRLPNPPIDFETTHCFGCDQKVPSVIIVGQEDDRGSCTTFLCKSCLEAALKLL